MSQPKIATSTGFLKIDYLNFDLLSGYDSDDSVNSGNIAPLVTDRGAMINFFVMPPQEEVLAEKPKLTGEQLTSSTKIVLDLL